MHLAVLHQIFDDVDAPLGHAVGELLDGDDLGDHDLALDLRLRLRAGDLLFLALLAALQRGKAPLALLFVERVDDGEPAAHPALLAAARCGDALLVPCIGGAGSLFSLLLGEVLARGLLADFARLGLGLMPLVFFALTLFRFFALFGPLVFGHDVERRRLLGLLALHRVALARVGERAHAGILLLFGELRQHDASLPRRRLVLNGLLNGLGGRGAGFCAAGSSTACAAPPAPIARRFFFSTRTDFERPWLKLWRTWPDSTVRRTLRVILRPPRAVLSSVSLVSLILCPYPIHSGWRTCCYHCGSAPRARPPRGISEPLHPG